jgi:S-adenosyl-L-methionine hydrolase (adenosine-forming)
MARPVIALLTDFGVRDHYAATMKGVILGICPDVTLVDISHDVPPHDVLAGALELAASYQYFPPGTIFLVVVDPGVGSARRGIAADAGDYKFVAPDNGVLSLVVEGHPPRRVVELSERRYARPTVSRTFEGRDRFAPAAAWLAKGVDLGALGRNAGALYHLNVPTPTVETGSGTVLGEVLRVDRFGNLITNIDRRIFDAIVIPGGRALEVHVGGHQVQKVVSTYADAGPGEICALFGSTDQLEIAANGASAAASLNLGRGAPVRIVIA